MELSDWLSLIAILVSVFTIFYQHKVEKKINDINLSIPFFEKIYFEALTKTIPDAQDAIYHDHEKQKIVGISNMKTALREIRKNERFFQYSNADYFDKVHRQSMYLDELLSKNIDIDKTAYLKFEKEIEEELVKLYNMILTQYKNS